jgi:hypothetical protein
VVDVRIAGEGSLERLRLAVLTKRLNRIAVDRDPSKAARPGRAAVGPDARRRQLRAAEVEALAAYSTAPESARRATAARSL